MKVLFIGGTGTISMACTKHAVSKGIEVFVLNRGEREKELPKGVKHIQCDKNNRKEMTDKLKSFKFDVVVNWISFTPDDVIPDIEMFAGKINQYIFISSASVYQKPPTHYIVTESTPAHNPFWEYSKNKIKCEDLLIKEYREKGFPATIVRPSHTYNERLIPSTMGHDYVLIDRMQKGKKLIIHDLGESLWTLTHNTDFAKGFTGLLGNVQSIGHIFHITSDEVLTWNQILQIMENELGMEAKKIYIPSNFINKVDPDVGAGLLGDKSYSMVFDNTKIKRFVPEFKATTYYAEGFRKILAWYEANPDKKSSDPGINSKMDKMIQAWEKVMR